MVPRARRPARSGEEEEEEEPSQRPFNLFDPSTWLSGLQSGASNFFGGLFNFGNIFTIGLLAFGAYFLARTQRGQELIKGIAGMLPEDWQVGLGEMLKNIGINIPGIGLDAIQTADQFRSLATNSRDPSQSRLPQSVVDVLAPAGDTATWIRNRDIIAATGANLTSGISDRLVFGLMFKTTPPAAGAAAGTAPTFTPNREGRDLLRNLLSALPPAQRGATTTGANATTGASAPAPDATTASILGAIRNIAADPAKVNLLLGDPETRQLMVDSIARFSPVPLNTTALNTFITHVGMTDAGQPTTAFTSFIGQTLNPSTQGGVGGALVTFLTSPEVTTNPRAAAPAWQAFAQSIPTASITDSGQRQVIELMQHSAEPTLTLVRTLGAEKTQELMTLLTAPAADANAVSTRDAALRTFVTDPANATIFKTFADAVDPTPLTAGPLKDAVTQLRNTSQQALTLAGAATTALAQAPAEQQTAFNGIIATLLNSNTNRAERTDAVQALLFNPQNRALIQTIGTQHIADANAASQQGNPLLTKRNLDHLLVFGRTIGGNEANATTVGGARVPTANAQRVLDALMDIALNQDPTKFKALNATQLSGFFGDATNRQAFDTLVAGLEVPRSVPEPQRTQLLAIKHAWSGNWTTNGSQSNLHHESVGDVLANENGAQFVLQNMRGETMWREFNAFWDGVLHQNVIQKNQNALGELSRVFTPAPAAATQTRRPAH